ncbi:hypothetical protein GCM10023160_25240 [Brachybacterium paraconglomeratum]
MRMTKRATRGRALSMLVVAGLVMLGGASAAGADSAVPESARYGGSVVSMEGDVQAIDAGTTPTGGWVEFTGDGTVTVMPEHITSIPTSEPGTVSPYATEYVGGGKWTYGTSIKVGGQKTCTSQYDHGSRRHSATVARNGKTDVDVQSAGELAFTHVGSWTFATCYAYWSNL